MDHRPILLLVFASIAPAALLAQPLSVSLSSPEFNGYNISCFGQRTGSIDATVSGGTPPYQYKWSNGSTAEDLANLAAGYYKLLVRDTDSTQAIAEITLMEPGAIGVIADPHVYPNGHNVSCHSCYNGSITVDVAGGVVPYTYAWSDGPTIKDRTSLGAMTLFVLVTDANGCTKRSETIHMTQPQRESWDMGGNTGTDPGIHYLGTADSADLVLKSAGTEILRLTGTGEVKLSGVGQGTGLLHRLPDGTLQAGGFPIVPPIPPTGPCFELSQFPIWETRGNTFSSPLCEDPVLGTLSAHPLRLVANGDEHMIITTNGKIGMGTVPPAGPIGEYRLFVQNGIATRDVLVKLGTWPDYVFDDGYRLMPFTELRAFLQRHRHLPGIPSAAELEARGGVEVGEMQRNLVKTVEEQALYILHLEERVKRMEQRLMALEASDR